MLSHLDGSTSDYYKSHPEARKKRVAQQAAINSRPEERKRRSELNQERRRRGIYGKGGPDMSHTTSGRMVPEDASTNRARNGHGKQERYKSDSQVQFYQPQRVEGRVDSPEGGKGKPCGASHIPKQKKCSKPVQPTQPKAAQIPLLSAPKAAALAGAVTAVAAGAALLHHRKKKYRSMQEWRDSPENPRNTPKISDQRNQKIVDEALAGKDKWAPQERINARRRRQLCGGRGDASTAKLDAFTRSRCQLGEGAFGQYFVHTSKKYGVKRFKEGGYDEAEWEFDLLGRAHNAGVNVPEPLRLNTADREDSVTATLTLRHLNGYTTMSDSIAGNGTLRNAPTIIQLKVAREFRKLHVEGIAHGDIHGGNMMVNLRTKQVALIDFGYAGAVDDYARNPLNDRTGFENIESDLGALPRFIFGYRGKDDFTVKFRDTATRVVEIAERSARSEDYVQSQWADYELAVNRWHDALEAEIKRSNEFVLPRSRVVSEVAQPRLPGFNRELVKAHIGTAQRRQIATMLSNTQMRRVILEGPLKQNLGMNTNQVINGLLPEIQARQQKRRQQLFGTPFPLT